MDRKASHTHRFTSVLYPPEWCYILWRYPFEKWTNHSTHYPSSRNELPYSPRPFRNWKIQKRARQSLFWPLMYSEIEDQEMIKKCSTCLTFRSHQPSEPIINHPIPNHAWTKIAADPFRLYRRYYLLMIDYYSKFTVIEMLKILQSSIVINKYKKIFSPFGTPKE